jgi:prophage regulatory protein
MDSTYTANSPTRPRILRRPEVEARTGLCRSAIYTAMGKGLFPRPVRIGAKAVGWHEIQVETWIESRAVSQGALNDPNLSVERNRLPGNLDSLGAGKARALGEATDGAPRSRSPAKRRRTTTDHQGQ